MRLYMGIMAPKQQSKPPATNGAPPIAAAPTSGSAPDTATTPTTTAIAAAAPAVTPTPSAAPKNGFIAQLRQKLKRRHRRHHTNASSTPAAPKNSVNAPPTPAATSPPPSPTAATITDKPSSIAPPPPLPPPPPPATTTNDPSSIAPPPSLPSPSPPSPSSPPSSPTAAIADATPSSPANPTTPVHRRRVGFRDVVPGLPRPPTLQRMQSEMRERLKPYQPPHHERRAHTKRLSASPPDPAPQARDSAPNLALSPIRTRSVSSSASDSSLPQPQKGAASPVVGDAAERRDPAARLINFSEAALPGDRKGDDKKKKETKGEEEEEEGEGKKEKKKKKEEEEEEKEKEKEKEEEREKEKEKEKERKEREEEKQRKKKEKEEEEEEEVKEQNKVIPPPDRTQNEASSKPPNTQLLPPPPPLSLPPPPPPPPPPSSLPQPPGLRGPRDSEPQIISASEEGLSDTSSGSRGPSRAGVAGEGGGDRDGDGPLVSQEIEDEMEWRWILNLSMHFRDQSNREKFFVTYAQERNLRRRLTISCDYRNAQDGSLEKELSRLHFQRDKSAKIYETIRDSLREILFYETITNLRLETRAGRLHVHVTEDTNEIIPYPPVKAIAHLRCDRFRESELEFDSHLSGFVYKVGVGGRLMIKKEIPGPDTVDEFLYEINALHALADSDHVIQFGGCVVDDQSQKVKGLLISFAPRGALIDILFHQRGRLPWPVREKWARQIVAGLAEIHEAGYVQGDFTLSNIVVDDHDDAKIIDINRRGCPVGWEPPEITVMVHGLQRIGMYIGVKSDIFQLGMVLWGMAHERDEPEQTERPLTMDQAPDDVPAYFREIVEACLCDRPQGRPAAKDIVAQFPEPRPRDWTAANGYFPDTYDVEQTLSPESTQPSLTTSFPHRNRLLGSPPDDDLISPTTQVIDAAPSESDFSDNHHHNPHHQNHQQYPPISATSSVVGGVGLDRGEGGGGGGGGDSEGGGGGAQRIPRLPGGDVGGSGGVAIPAEEYVQLIARPGTAGSSTDRADTPRPPRAESHEREEQTARRPEWEKQAVRTHEWEEQDRLAGNQTPFEDSWESFHTPGETTPPTPPTAVVGIAA